VVNEQRAFDKLATVKAREKALASKIEILGLKAFAPDDALFRDHLNPAGCDREQPISGSIKPLLGALHVGQMSDQFAGQPIDIDPF
jgi:hypothetical protein